MSKIVSFIKQHGEVFSGISLVVTIVGGGFELYKLHKNNDEQLNIYKQKERIQYIATEIWLKNNDDYQKKIAWYLRPFYPPCPMIIPLDKLTTPLPQQPQIPS